MLVCESVSSASSVNSLCSAAQPEVELQRTEPARQLELRAVDFRRRRIERVRQQRGRRADRGQRRELDAFVVGIENRAVDAQPAIRHAST